MPEPIKVLSQQPPGGRCTLYALYAEALSSSLGLAMRVIHTDCRDPHGEGFPSMRVKDVVLRPADGVILSPQDICDGLAAAGVDLGVAAGLRDRLETIQDRFLANL